MPTEKQEVPAAIVHTAGDQPPVTPVVAGRESAASAIKVEPGPRIPWMRLALELATVTAGVLLALAADQWREQRDRRQRAETAIESIRHEVLKNRAVVEDRLPYHKRLLDSVQVATRAVIERGPRGLQLKREARMRTPQEMGFARGLMLSPRLASTAWQTALATGVLPSLDYSTTFAISTAYTKQEELLMQIDDLSDQLPLIVGGLYNVLLAQLDARYPTRTPSQAAGLGDTTQGAETR